jgi:predicted ATPase
MIAELLPAADEGRDLDDLARAVTATTAGNPFFIRETVRRVLESQDDDAPLADIVPPTVQATIGERIVDIPRPVRQLLDAAAVIGQRLDVALLAAVTGQ